MSLRCHLRLFAPAVLGAVLLSSAAALSGCAGVSNSVVSEAFVDPAKYALYDCKQLAPERDRIAKQLDKLNGLMAKARTGAGGAVVAEVAYRNDYITAKGEQRLADEAWRENKCTDADAVAAPVAPGAPGQSKRAVY